MAWSFYLWHLLPFPKCALSEVLQTLPGSGAPQTLAVGTALACGGSVVEPDVTGTGQPQPTPREAPLLPKPGNLHLIYREKENFQICCWAIPKPVCRAAECE